jgi:hypothetical protein
MYFMPFFLKMDEHWDSEASLMAKGCGIFHQGKAGQTV